LQVIGDAHIVFMRRFRNLKNETWEGTKFRKLQLDFGLAQPPPFLLPLGRADDSFKALVPDPVWARSHGQ
jgi:hypothetical protein